MSKQFDRVLINGKIFTSNPDQPEAEAMAIKNGKIAWIGALSELPGDGEETVDLKGRRVLPGLIDAHMHPLMVADNMNQIACVPPATNSIKELQDQIRAKREAQGTGVWIRGWGYDEGKLAEHRAPNRWDLDEACADSPILLVRTCVHVYSVNSKVLEMAGIDRNTPDPEGGQIDRDENGEPTGILRENAKDLIDRIVPAKAVADSTDDMVKLSRKLLSQGITVISEAFGETEPTDFYEIYNQAREKGMKQRVAIYYKWEYLKDQPVLPAKKTCVEEPIHVHGVKVIMDGSVGGRTAWRDRPYLGEPDNFGLPVATEEEMILAGELAKKNKIQLVAHAMGEQAMARVVDYFCDKADWLGDVPAVRIEHASMPTPDIIEKAARGGIAFVSQPIFMYAEIESYLKNIGGSDTKGTYPYKTYLDKGIKLIFSSDAPATAWADPSDPFVAIKSAVTRKAYEGTDTGQDERVDITTALELYTRKAQEVLGIPEIGQLKPGYFADFTVLDRDILSIDPETIDQVQVEETYVNGVLEYRK